MISAMIQAIKRDENNVVVLDGQILSGDEARKCAENIFDEVDKIKYSDKEQIQKIRSNKFFCNIYHPQKDDLGRIRTALIVWDKGTSLKLVQSTINALGLDYEKWEKLFGLYQKKRKKQMLTLCLTVLVGVALVLVVIN